MAGLQVTLYLLAAALVARATLTEFDLALLPQRPGRPTTRGTEFIFAFMANDEAQSPADQDALIIITTEEPDPVEVTVEVNPAFYENNPNLNATAFPRIRRQTVARGSSITFPFPVAPLIPGNPPPDQDIRVYTIEDALDRNSGINISTDGGEVSVYGLNNELSSVDAFSVFPCREYPGIVGNYEYVILSAEREDRDSRLMIVGCQDNTAVTITPPSQLPSISPSVPPSLGGGPTPQTPRPSQPLTITDLDQLTSIVLNNQQDLSGTTISSTRPIAVFTGHECGNIPIPAVGTCNHLIQQVPPQVTWGRLFFTVPIVGRYSGDHYRVATITRNTQFTVTCRTLTNSTPTTRSFPIDFNDQTNAGFELFNTNIGTTSGDRASRKEDLQWCCIESNNPVLVMQYAQGLTADMTLKDIDAATFGDPLMTIVPPVVQYLNNYTVPTEKGLRESRLDVGFTIAIPQDDTFFRNPTVDGSRILLNDEAIMPDPDEGWIGIYCASGEICGYSARVEHAPDGVITIRHVDPRAAVSAWVYGIAGAVSFGFTAGFKLDAVTFPIVSADNVTVMEVNGTAVVTFTRTGDISFSSRFNIAVVPGTATSPADYNPTYVANPTNAIRRTFSPTRTELVMRSNVATVTATFDITVDTIPEGCECFFLHLEGTRRVFILTPVVSVCIFNVSVMCPDLVEIDNGMVTVTCNSVGDTATYTCDSGFELIGSATTTCTQENANSTAFQPAPPVCRHLPDTSSSPVGLAAGAAVAGIAVLIILTVVVVLVVWLWRRQRYHEKENAGLPLQLTTVSPLPNEANCDESLEGSTQLGGAEYSTVRNTPCETVPVDIYDRPSVVNSGVTRAKQPEVTSRATIENQHYARHRIDKLTAPTVEQCQEELLVSEGERVTLMVEASGSPQPNVTWVYKGREVEADCATELGEDGSLTLVCVEPKHAGTYHFTASNEVGSVEGSIPLVVCAAEEQGEGGTGLATVESSPLEVEQFGEGVSRLLACNNAGFILQYQSLPSREAEKSVTIGTSPVNRSRNRFNNIIAYDSYRIILEHAPNLEHDYINASYIDGHSKPKKYIATQGPLPSTVADFWRLVWQEKVQAIAMLTNVTEGYQRKCEQYWPESSKTFEEYGPFEVTVVDQKVFADYTVRIIQLEQSGMVGVRRKIAQFHFTSWPDHGVPEYAGSLLAYLRRIKAKYRPSKGPLLVHCSAGVGRTGTLIAIDIAVEQAAKEGVVDIAGIVCRMRGQRMKMVQTPEQYVFIHDAVLESLACGDTQISSSELSKAVQRLSVKNEQTGKTGFEMQLHVLDQVTPNPNEVVRSAALNNREKNRNMDFLPPDNWRVVLKTVSENYIHASYANGYKQNKGFIIAQPPMRSSVCDFWKMVYERECGVIVMLSDIIEDRKEVCFPYWPKVDKRSAQKYGGYAVSAGEFIKQDGYSRRIFSITGPESATVHKVTQFQLSRWSSEGLCTDHKALIGLVEQVTTEQMRAGNKPIVVHGSDTVSRSGIFCAFMNAMECCKAEGTVDVFQVVRALRIQKPGAVPTVEQYCSVFDLMLLFFEKTDIYSNFK